MQICKLIFYGDYIRTGTDSYVIYCLGQIFPLLFMVILIQTHGSYFESILFAISKSLIQLCTSVVFQTLIVLLLIIQIAFVFILEYIMPSKLQCLTSNQISILQLIISIQNIYNQLLRFPYLFMIGVNLSLNYREPNFEKYIVTFICAILSTIINTFYVMISNSLLLINYRSLKRIRNNIFDQFINQLLTSAIPFIVGITILFENKIFTYHDSVITLSFLGLLNSIYIMYQIFIKLIYYNHIQVYAILLINSLMVIFCIGILLEIEYEILIVNFPLLVHILYQQFKRITLQTLLKDPKRLEQDELSLAIFWQIKCPLNKQELIIYQCHQLLSHQRRCHDIKCICRQDLIRINKTIQKIQLDEQKDSWNLQFINRITRQQYICSLSNICHYLSALLYVKQFTRLYMILCQNYNFDRLDQMKYSTFCYLIKKDVYKIKMNQVQQLNNQGDFIQVHKLIRNDNCEKQVRVSLERIIENKINLLKQMQIMDNKLFYSKYEYHMKIISNNQKQAEYLMNNVNLPFRHFLFGHILNNWIKVLYEHKPISIEQNTQYIQFDYDLIKIKVNSYSKGIPELLQYTQQEFKEIEDLNELLPQYIKNDHPNQVNEFFNTGKCKYYQEKDTIFLKQKNSILLQMIASFEVLLSYNFIRIIMLLQPNPQQDAIIIINEEYQILGLTQTVLSQVNQQFVDLKQIKLSHKIDRDYLVIPGYIDKNGQNHRQKYLSIVGNIEKKDKFIYYHIYQLEQGRKSNPTIIKQIQQIEEYDENELIDIPYDICNKQRSSLVSNGLLNSIFISKYEDSNPISVRNTIIGQISSQQIIPSLDFIHENKKFITYLNMTQENFKDKSIQRLPYLLLLITLVKLIFIFVNIIDTYDDLNIQSYFRQFVQINHHIIEPMQKFYLARQTLLNYHVLNENDQLTIEEYYFYANFSNQNILEEYSKFKYACQTILSDMRLQQFIFSQEIQIKQQSYHMNPVQVTTYDTNINTAFSILLDSMYQQEIIYSQNKRVRPYVSTTTYQMVNYLLFVKIFEDLSITYQNEAMYQGDKMLNKQLTVLVTMTLINTFLIVIAVYHLVKLKNQVESYINLRIYIKQTDIQEECIRLGELLKILRSEGNNYPNIIFKEEKKIQQQQYRNHFVRFVLPIGWKKIIIILIVLCDVFVWQWISSILGFRELSKFPIQIDILKQISDISVVIPAGFEYSEILYFWDKYTYLTALDKEGFINETLKSIKIMDNFKNLQLNEIGWLSQEFRGIYNEMLSGDLCRLLEQQNRKRKYINFNYTCYNSNLGILQYGLLSSIAQLKDTLNLKLLTNFTYREIPILQLEAVYLSSDAIYCLTDELDSQIEKISQDYYSSIIIISIMGCISACIFLFAVKYYLNNTLQNILWRAKLFLYIIPQITLHYSDDLEREMRALFIKTQN